MFDLTTRTWSYIHANPDPVHSKSFYEIFFLNFLFDFVDYPAARKFHSVLPFHKNQMILFGGAYYDDQVDRHAVVSEQIWKFNFEKLEWSLLPSLNMVKTTYFHAAAMNEVMIHFYSHHIKSSYI